MDTIILSRLLTSPAFSVLALLRRSEKTGPGHKIVILIPVPTFSVRSELK